MPKRITDTEVDARLVAKSFTRTGPYVNSDTPILAVHDVCGRSVSVRLGDLDRMMNGCRHCGYEARAVPNKLTVNEARESFFAAGMEMVGEYVNSQTPTLCRCVSCGSTGSPSLTSVRNNGQGGCVPCGYKRVATALSHDPVEYRQRIDWTVWGMLDEWPRLVTTPVRWVHIPCGRHSTSDLHTHSRNGCRRCDSAPGGFHADHPAEVYLIVHDDLAAMKVGVQGVDSVRLDKHEALGWRVVHVVRFSEGADALDREAVVLDRLGYHPHGFLLPEHMPQGGWTETAPIDSLDDALALIRSS